jgi:hypothetical protein
VTDYPVNDYSDAGYLAFEADVLDHFDNRPPAPESFDATAALRRVLALADGHEGCCGTVNIASLREAVRGER